MRFAGTLYVPQSLQLEWVAKQNGGRMDNGLQWNVKHDRYVVPFKSFQRALTYADQIASQIQGVKLIDMEKATIRIEQLPKVAWAEEQPGDRPAATRYRRNLD